MSLTTRFPDAPWPMPGEILLAPWRWAALFANDQGHTYPVSGTILISNTIECPEAQAEIYVRLYIAQADKYANLTLKALAVRKS